MNKILKIIIFLVVITPIILLYGSYLFLGFILFKNIFKIIYMLYTQIDFKSLLIYGLNIILSLSLIQLVRIIKNSMEETINKITEKINK